MKREEIIKEIESLGIITIEKTNYENMSNEALQLRLKIFKSMLEK